MEVLGPNQIHLLSFSSGAVIYYAFFPNTVWVNGWPRMVRYGARLLGGCLGSTECGRDPRETWILVDGLSDMTGAWIAVT